MKRLVNRLFTWGLAGTLLVPHIANARNNFQENKPEQKISDSRFIPVGKTAKPVLEEKLLRIENPIPDISMKTKSTYEQDIKDVYSYNGSSKILTEIKELDPEDLIDAEINDKGKLVVTSKDKTGRAGIVAKFYENSVGVAPASFGGIKRMFKDGKRKPLAKSVYESVSVSDTFYVDVTKAMSNLECFVWNLLSEDYSTRLVQGAVVEVNGVKDTTDENGKVKFQVEKGFSRMKIKHPKFYDWTTSVLDFTNDMVREENLILKKDVEVCDKKDWSRKKVGLDVIFKMWWQETISGKIEGWGREGELAGQGPKNIYINTSPASEIEITKDKIALNYEIINYVAGHGFMNMPNIEEGTSPPEMGAYDWVNTWWRNSGGPGYHFEDLNGNQIYSGGVWFNLTGPDRRIYLEEITQCCAGATTETETAYFWNKEGYYLPVVKDLALILRHRFIGGTMCEGP